MGASTRSLVVEEDSAKARRGGGEDLVTRQGICGICPAGCWVEVGLREGRLETIRPDESHALGMICRRGQHAPEIIYSENRLRYPLRCGARDPRVPMSSSVSHGTTPTI